MQSSVIRRSTATTYFFEIMDTGRVSPSLVSYADTVTDFFREILPSAWIQVWSLTMQSSVIRRSLPLLIFLGRSYPLHGYAVSPCSLVSYADTATTIFFREILPSAWQDWSLTIQSGVCHHTGHYYFFREILPSAWSTYWSLTMQSSVIRRSLPLLFFF